MYIIGKKSCSPESKMYAPKSEWGIAVMFSRKQNSCLERKSSRKNLISILCLLGKRKSKKTFGGRKYALKSKEEQLYSLENYTPMGETKKINIPVGEKE